MPPAPPKSYAGALALLCAMLAFAASFLTDWGGELNQPPPKSWRETATETASSVTDSVKSWVAGDAPVVVPVAPPNKPTVDWAKRARSLSVLTAVLGVLLAAFAYVRREDERKISTALALAGAALAYHLVLKGLIALLAGLAIATLLKPRR
jgi:hypothetical protein